MNNIEFRPVGSLSTFGKLRPGEFGIYTEQSWDNEPRTDSLILACNYDDPKLDEFANEQDSICIKISKSENKRISGHLVNPYDKIDDWVYLPNQSPSIEVDLESRQKSRYDKPTYSPFPLYLSPERDVFLRVARGCIELNAMKFAVKGPDFAYLMPISSWRLVENNGHEKATFWSTEG
ncbi:MAG: hypothetical protein ABJN69_05155 [Hellea sp.]